MLEFLLEERDLLFSDRELLSKKLNLPVPKKIPLTGILEFLYQIKVKSSLVWLCIAKVLVHINPLQPVMPETLPSA